MSWSGKVLIVGAGITGLALAASLGRRGIRVEIKPTIQDQGGIGLSIMGNASKALATIDVANQCVAAGMPTDMLTIRNPLGDIVATPSSTGVRQTRMARADWHFQGRLSRIPVVCSAKSRRVDPMRRVDRINRRP